MHPRVTISRSEPPRRRCGARYVQDQVRRLRPRGSTALLAILALASTWVLVPQGRAVAASERRGSGVLPASATPAGYSLADMTRLLALFTTSGNDPSRYPDTPFQILYTNPDPTLNQTNFVTKDHAPCPTPPPNPQCGYFSTQTGAFSNTFRVEPGTMFFVPVDNADDSPPVVEPFPTTPRGAKSYVFDPQQLGGRGFTVIIDSKSVPLGPGYVAGPVETPPLLDGGGTHIITLGAFLGPLTPGSHTVRIKGGYFGAGIEKTYQFAFVSEDFTYQIEVTSD
jgi:hypothetical protein